MSDKPKDPPIEHYPGTNVIEIGEARVQRGFGKYGGKCLHNKLTYCTRERRVWCCDCERTIDNFDAFEKLVSQHQSGWDRIRNLQEELTNALKHSVRRVAAKNIDKIWRGNKMAPVCPHCKAALLPEDFAKISGQVNVEFERKRREK